MSTSHLTNTRSGELGSEPLWDCKPVAHEQHGAEADLLAACVVVSSVWVPNPCKYVAQKGRPLRETQSARGGDALDETRWLPKPATSQLPEGGRTLRDPWCRRPKSLASPSAPIYEMACTFIAVLWVLTGAGLLASGRSFQEFRREGAMIRAKP